MRKTLIEDTPELTTAGRTMALLALEKLRQDGSLGVRQREQLRRAFSAAADALDWSSIPGSMDDCVATAESDVAELAAAGAESLKRDLSELLDEKKVEIERVEEVVTSLHALAADPSASYPTEVVYSHTARDGTRRLVTKTETLTLNDADEALAAAAKIEKQLESYAKLRDQMVEELEEQRGQIEEMRHGLSVFVASSNGLVGEVLATLA
ncbi:MAG: hypothetical protein U5R14_09800 [Gemmatimonadota bacterium]|nr:hypothetical protein [Gemmatimonadota bacterium]